MSPRKKKCFVPGCGNVSTQRPAKVFVCIPSDHKVNSKWQQAAGVIREGMKTKRLAKTTGRKFCCEDHFDRSDFSNYNIAKRQDGGGRVRFNLNPGVIPHKFGPACKTVSEAVTEVRQAQGYGIKEEGDCATESGSETDRSSEHQCSPPESDDSLVII